MKLVLDEETAGRILVALDASRQGFAALEAAAALAAELRAELHGLFVEDSNLLKLAALPFSQEVSFTACGARPLDAVALRRRLSAKAEEARRVLEERASRAQIVHSFRVSRGVLIHETLAARESADVLVVGHQSRSTGGVAKRAASPAIQPVMAFCPNTPGGRRTLALAGRVARADGRPVMLLFPRPESASDREFTEQCRLWLEGQQIVVRIHSQAVLTSFDLLRAARRSSSQILLLALDSQLLDEAAIDRLACEAGFPVVLVR